VTMIINSYPILIPMVLNSRGRWIEKLPWFIYCYPWP
jgi:hypothetical protein